MKRKDTEFEVAYRDSFDFVDYYNLVNQLVEGYFNEDGDYLPQIGDAVAMTIFFNVCIIDKEQFSDLEIIEDPLEAGGVFEDEDFIEAFNEAIFFNGQIRFDFANAFKNALEIVNYRTSSLTYASKVLTGGIKDIINRLDETYDDERLQTLATIAENVASSDFNAKAVSDAFAETEAFQKIMDESGKVNE